MGRFIISDFKTYAHENHADNLFEDIRLNWAYTSQ